MVHTTAIIVLVIFFVTPTLSVEWCTKLDTVIWHLNRGTDKVYPNVKRAKAACKKDAGCGAVGVDKIPYRKENGDVKYPQTVYLVSAKDVENKSAKPFYRYDTYVKGDC